jgi:hypothetical protein
MIAAMVWAFLALYGARVVFGTRPKIKVARVVRGISCSRHVRRFASFQPIPT